MNEVSDSKSWVMSKYKEEWIWWRNGTQGIFFFFRIEQWTLLQEHKICLAWDFAYENI